MDGRRHRLVSPPYAGDDANAGRHDPGFAPISKSRGLFARLIDSEQDRLFFWTPICFGLGIAAYFELPREPSLFAALMPLVIAGLLLATVARGTIAHMLVTGVLLAALGFSMAKVRVEHVRAPVITKPIHRAEITGTVVIAEPRGNRGQRLTIDVEQLTGVATEDTPARVRVRTLKKNAEKIRVGERIKVTARLSPPSQPVIPGGFDFARTAWFERLGAVGYTFQTPEKLPRPAEATVLEQASQTIQRLRDEIARRIHAVLPDERGAMAVALMTGERGGISAETNEAYRSSGLFHILSISGLHMVVMAGTMFLLVRALLAAVPMIALNAPVKKLAAIAGMVAAVGYLAISGGAFATVRAALMTVIAFTAVLFDRPAIALRNVALSALVILVLYPESILDAGFQMSFAAVTALVAVYEEYRRRKFRGFKPAGGTTKAMRFFGGIIMTTVIASLAVAPFAAFHFHQSQQLSLLANIMAIPICNFVVMPAALATYVLMPFGLEALSLNVLGAGISGMTWCAHFVADLPGAVSRLPAFSTLAFALMVFGGLWLLLWQSRLRLAGGVMIATGIALAPMAERPDLLVGRNASLVAVRTAQGTLEALPAKRTKYELSRWLQYDGDARDVRNVMNGQTFRCDALGCVGRQGSIEIVVPHHPAAFVDDCRPKPGVTRVVVMSVPRPESCTEGVKVVDLFDVWRDGTHAFYFSDLAAMGADVSTSATTSDVTHGSAHDTPSMSASEIAPAIARIDTFRARRGERPWSPVWRPTKRRTKAQVTKQSNAGETSRASGNVSADETSAATPLARPANPSDQIDDDIAEAEGDVSDAVR